MSDRGYFATVERQEALEGCLERWRGTPFVRQIGAEAKAGVGADCVSFVAGVLLELGAIQPFVWPRYVVAGGGEAMLEVMLRVLKGIPELREVARFPWGGGQPEILPGDVLLASGGRARHHLAICARHNALWHATELSRGVAVGNVHDPALRRWLLAVYRPMERMG